MKHFIDSMPVLILDVYSRCNCRCIMCDIWKRSAVRQLSVDVLIRQLPAIERLGVQWVVLTGGEPLMHPELFQLCAPLKRRGIRITLLTTGLLLERFPGDIVRNIDDVIVSLDGPPEIHNRIRRVRHGFEQMAAGIQSLRNRQARFPVSARSTVQRENCACLTATVDAARRLGCDSISFLAIDTQSSAFNHQRDLPPECLDGLRPGLADIEVLSAEVERLIRSGECGGFIAETPQKLTRIVDFSRWSLGAGDPVAPECNAPWFSAVMDADGVVRPCFFHPPVGRITAEAALDVVLNSTDAVTFRSRLQMATDPICRRCVCSFRWKTVSSLTPLV